MRALRTSFAALAGLLVGSRAVRSRARARIEAAVTQVSEARPEAALVEVVTRRPAPAPPDPGTPVTDALFARLGDGDPQTVAEVLTGTEAELYAMSGESGRRRLTLNFAVANRLDQIWTRAGLVAAMPPDDVHAMARGPVAAGGDLYLADLVFSALAAAGFELKPGATLLDFGASSGRVLRVIAAARPDLRCRGCDPNPGAIAWAAQHLPGEYFVSPQHPPLADVAAASLDVAYAISIWSHFAASPALAWLAEMHRIIAPGGALVLTTHGWDTLATGLRRSLVAPSTVANAVAGLVEEGHFFIDVFGEQGDWGVKDPGWGNAYLTLEWLVARTNGAWAVRLAWLGYLDLSQDVIVLERR